MDIKIIEKIHSARRKLEKIKSKIHQIKNAQDTAMRVIQDIEYTIKDIITSIPNDNLNDKK